MLAERSSTTSTTSDAPPAAFPIHPPVMGRDIAQIKKRITSARNSSSKYCRIFARRVAALFALSRNIIAPQCTVR